MLQGLTLSCVFPVSYTNRRACVYAQYFGVAQKWVNQNKKLSRGTGLLDLRDAGYDSKCTLVRNKETPSLWIHFVSPPPKIAGMELLNCGRLSWIHC